MLIDFWRDLCYSSRTFSRSPLFTSSIILSLALGIGLNIAVFSFLHSLFLNPATAVNAPDRVTVIYSETDGGPSSLPISYPNYRSFLSQVQSFAELAAYQEIQVVITDEGEAENVSGEMVTANFFPALGVDPAIGRLFLPEEDRTRGTHSVAVLSHGLWQRRFGGEADILGRKISLNGHPFTIIGVAEEGFDGMNALSTTGIWVPLMMYPTVFSLPELLEVRSAQILQLVGRLGRGVSLSMAEAEMKTVARRLEAEFPNENRGQSVRLEPLTSSMIHPNRRQVFERAGALLMGIVGLLLLIACANVANLLLVRSFAREREFALRLSLGASRWHLTRQILAECLLFSLAGGVAGLGLAFTAWRLLWRLRPPFIEETAIDLSLNLPVLGFALLVSLATSVLFGLAPLLRVLRTDPASELRKSGTLIRLGRSRFSAGDAFVTAQIALCAVSLACTGLFLRSLGKALEIDPGFSTERILMLSFDLHALGYDEARGRALQESLRVRAERLPGVRSAAIGENRLLGAFRLWRSVVVEGRELGAQETGVLIGSSVVGPDYFETVGIPVLAGRSFATADRAESTPVAIVNETTRRLFWGDRSPLGARLLLDGEAEPVEIVGVVGDSKYRTIGEEPTPFLYLPWAQRYSARGTLHVRTSGNPESLMAAVRREARRLEPSLPLGDLWTVTDVINQSLWAPRMIAMLLSVFSLLALVLAAIGIYGVTAQMARRRSFEIGVRMALGARRPTIIQLLLARSFTVVGFGLLLGLAGAILLRQWIVSLLYGAEEPDMATFIGALVLLTAVSLVATYFPAARAARMELLKVIRNA